MPRLELHQIAWAASKLVPGAVRFRLVRRRPRSRTPVWPAVLPTAGNRLPLCGSAVSADSARTARRERVVLALQAVLVLDHITVPGIARLNIKPPGCTMHAGLCGGIHSVQTGVVPVVVGKAVTVPCCADFGTRRINIRRFVVPPGIYVKAQVGCIMLRFLGETWAGRIPRTVRYAHDPKAGCRYGGLTIRPAFINAS